MQDIEVKFGTPDITKGLQSYELFAKSFGFSGLEQPAPDVSYEYYGGLKAGQVKCNEQLSSLQKAWEKAQLTKDPSFTTTTGGTYTGYGLFPPYIDPSIVDRTVRETPLVKLLARRAVGSKTYVYNPLTTKSGAQWYGEDPSLSNQNDTYTTTSINLKYLYAVGAVTRPAMLSASIINPMEEKIRVATASLNEALEDEIINGNTSTNALGFQGLIQTISTNTVNNSGAAITLDQVRVDLNTSFEANGNIDLAVTDGTTHNVLKGLLMDYYRYVDEVKEEMAFGIPGAFKFDGVLFIRDRYMPTTAAARRVLYLDLRYVYLAVLQDYTYEEAAKVNPSQKFWISWYGVLVVPFEASCVMRYGIA
jgi:HK97 family phage major capsid protein